MLEAQNIEGLDCLYQKAGSDNAPAVILLHGYGASQQDLAPLADYLSTGDSFHWYFPNAPLEVPLGPYMSGRAWFNINMAELERAMMDPTYKRVFGEGRPDGFVDAAEKVLAFLQEVKQRHGKVILGGFSQGSMLSADIGLDHRNLIDGLILLSSTMVARERWNELLETPPKFKIFQSHGENDPVLPYDYAVELKDLLNEKNCQLEFHNFPGGHEIPPPILSMMDQFLKEHIDG